jgi:hypothetical protein
LRPACQSEPPATRHGIVRARQLPAMCWRPEHHRPCAQCRAQSSTAHVRCAIDLIPARHSFIEANPFLLLLRSPLLASPFTAATPSAPTLAIADRATAKTVLKQASTIFFHLRSRLAGAGCIQPRSRPALELLPNRVMQCYRTSLLAVRVARCHLLPPLQLHHRCRPSPTTLQHGRHGHKLRPSPLNLDVHFNASLDPFSGLPPATLLRPSAAATESHSR